MCTRILWLAMRWVSCWLYFSVSVLLLHWGWLLWRVEAGCMDGVAKFRKSICEISQDPTFSPQPEVIVVGFISCQEPVVLDC